MRQQITLRSDDAEQFEEMKQRVADRRGGNEPTNAELVRLLMGRANL